MRYDDELVTLVVNGRGLEYDERGGVTSVS
jgi:hypothetical protein